jgi:Zn-dependent oligopeptidase
MHQNENPIPEQQISNTKIKVLSQARAIKNKMKQLANEIEKITAVPAHSNGTEYVQPLTTRQQTWRDKFSDTVPDTFAPP